MLDHQFTEARAFLVISPFINISAGGVEKGYIACSVHDFDKRMDVRPDDARSRS